MPTVVLSPHLDDAVFSCWHVLFEPDTTIITIFAGAPPKGTTTLWDKICGQPDSETMMRSRLEENEAVLASIGVSGCNLDFLDGQYGHSQRNISEIADSVLAMAGQNAVFLAPLAGSLLWRHPDHVVVRTLGTYLLGKGKEVAFYADLPYMQMPACSATAYVARMSKRASKIIGVQLSAEVHTLNVSEQSRKRTAMRQYQTQFTMTNLVSLGTLGRKANSQREVTFSLA